MPETPEQLLEKAQAAADMARQAADAAQVYADQLAATAGAAAHAASGGAIDPFVFRFAIFVLAIFVGYTNVAGRVAQSASSLYARNLFNFIETMVDKTSKALAVNWDDELVKATALTKEGAVIHPNFQPK